MSAWPSGTSEMDTRIAAHDWASTSLGPVASWPAMVRATIELVLASPMVASIAVGDERRLIYNDASARLYGDRHPAALGAPLGQTFVESYPAVAELYDRVFYGEAVVVYGQPLAVGTDGGGEVFDAYLTPVRDESGAVVAAHMVGFEVGAKVRSQVALRESEARYRNLFESIDEGFCIIEMLFDQQGKPNDYRFLELNPVFERQANFTIAPGQHIREIAPDHEQFWFDVYGRIACTGEPERFEHWAEAFGVFYDVYAFRVEAPELRHVAVLFRDITERKRAQAQLRESEEQQAFLLKLSDTLRLLSDPVAAQTEAMRLLVEHLDLVRVATYEVDGNQNDMTLIASVETDPVVWPQAMRMADYAPDIADAYRTGRTYAVNDVENDARLPEQGRAAIRALGIRSLVGIPLVKEEKLRIVLGVHAREPRDWGEHELRLLEETAERLWSNAERALAEAALRESEDKFRTLFEGLDEGLSVQELIFDAGGRVVDWIYLEANSAFEIQRGFPNPYGKRGSEVNRHVDQRVLDQMDRVARTGVPERSESYLSHIDRHFRFQMSRIGAADSRRLAVVFEDVTDRKRMEAVLRESEERQTFLLKLSDTLRPLHDARAMQQAAIELLGEQLAVNRAGYYEVGDDQDTFFLTARWENGAPPLPERMLISDFSDEIGEGYRAGRTMVARETEQDAMTDHNLAAVRALEIRAWIGVPLVKDGRWFAAIGVHSLAPRDWTPAEIRLVEEVGERTWAAIERARAETALRESEARLTTVLEGVGEAFYALDRDWRFLFASRFALKTWGKTAEDVLGHTFLECFPQAEGSDAYQAHRRVMETGAAERVETISPVLNHWLEIDITRSNTGGLSVAFRDIHARKLAEAALQESEARLIAAFESSPLGVGVIDVAGKIVFSNSEFRRFLPSGVLPSRDAKRGGRWRAWDDEGRPVAMSDFPGARALRGEMVVPGLDMLYTDDDGREIWTNITNAPVLDDAGRVTGAVSVINDIDVLKRSTEALRESEERQRLMIELVPALLWSANPDGQEVSLNERWVTYTGQIDADTQDYGWLNAIHPDDLPEAKAAFEQAFATGEPLERQQRIHKAGDGYRWHLVRQVPVRDDTGAITRWFGAAVDIHDSVLAEQALKETERRLQTLVEGVPQLVWRAVDGGHWTWASPQWTDYTGQAEADSHGRGWLQPVHPDDRDHVLNIWDGAVERGEFQGDYRICHKAEDRYRWFQTRATPVRDDRGEIVEWLGTSTDVDDLRGLQERQQVLVAELQHRTRNLIGVVRSTADRTGQASVDFADFRRRFQDRLEALARVQGLLSRLNDNDRIAFDELIQTEIAAMNGAFDRVTLEGPTGIKLRSSMVQTLAMALHELATNAVKYGALGQPDGHLAISWHIVEPDRRGRLRLRIEWRESGVKMPPAGAAPQGGGQGRELIERALPYQLSAETSFELGPDGVRCTITIPVSANTAAENANG